MKTKKGLSDKHKRFYFKPTVRLVPFVPLEKAYPLNTPQEVDNFIEMIQSKTGKSKLK